MRQVSEQLRARLERDVVLWLTTTRRDGSPVSRPVWFVWDGSAIVVYSRPTAHKVVHLVERPRASAHFEAGLEADDVVVIDVRADVRHDAPPPSRLPEYSARYAGRIERLGFTQERYDELFNTEIRLELLREVPVLDELP